MLIAHRLSGFQGVPQEFPCQSHPADCTEATDPDCAQLHKIISANQKDGWSFYYDEVAVFLRQYMKDTDRKTLRMVEIGTAYGGLASYLLANVEGLTLHAVDPFLPNYDTSDAHSVNLENWRKERRLTPEAFSAAWGRAITYDIGTRQGRGCRYFLHRQLSVDGMPQFAPESLDVVFIDGLHTPEGAAADVAVSVTRIVPGGLVAFNDYTHFFPGVGVSANALAVQWGGAGAKPVPIGEPGHGNVYVTKPGGPWALRRA